MIYTVSDPWDDRKNKIAEFGMLSATKEYLGQGLGRGLVKKAEERAKKAGCDRMKTTLAVPKDWEHPMKQRLGEWYKRMGYVRGNPQDFKVVNPHIIFNQPACPLNIVSYSKSII
jgi:GNAT superfamily N-acetyltransferase